MINNYLDYAKSQRKAALKVARQYRSQSRSDYQPWGQGFYAGHAQARWFESRHWRTLQKDIEARKAVAVDVTGKPFGLYSVPEYLG